MDDIKGFFGKELFSVAGVSVTPGLIAIVIVAYLILSRVLK